MNDKNLAHMFFNRVRKYGDRACLLVKKQGEWTPLSWNAMGEAVRNLGLGLLSLGLRPGEKLSLLSENRPEWTVADLATLGCGGILVSIYATNTPEQVRYIVDHSDSRFVAVSDAKQLRKVLEMSDALPKVEHIIVFDPIQDVTDADARVRSVSEVCELGKSHPDPKEFERRIEGVSMDQVATLIYTSGTTGDPKGVMLTHGNIHSDVALASKIMPVNDTDVTLSFLPLSHVFERTVSHFWSYYIGGTIAYAESIDALPANFMEVRPTLTVSVPRIYEKIYERVQKTVESSGAAKKRMFEWAVGVGKRALEYRIQRKKPPATLAVQAALADRLVFSTVRERFGGRLRFCACAGAPMNREITEFFHAAGVIIYEGYGLTETSPIVTVNTPAKLRLGTVGQTLPGMEVKIADDGEILCRGPNVMAGYYKNEQETARVMEGGWFHTGDIGVIDADGYLRITDRKKDLIITAGGKNVAPQNIEGLLKMESLIEEVNVVGDRRKYLTAVIVPNFEEIQEYAKQNGIAFESIGDLVAHERIVALIGEAVARVNASLAPFETIKKFILSEIAFTQENNMMTPTLKVKRKVVNRYFADEIEKLYAQ